MSVRNISRGLSKGARQISEVRSISTRSSRGGERKLTGNVELQEAAHELTGIAFSLWRAVFLSDVTDEFSDQLSDINKFLVSLISDNTVLYITDKNARNWSFRYYLKNARQRLELLSDSRLSFVDKSDLSRPADSDKDDWAGAQAMLDEAIRRFGDAMIREP